MYVRIYIYIYIYICKYLLECYHVVYIIVIYVLKVYIKSVFQSDVKSQTGLISLQLSCQRAYSHLQYVNYIDSLSIITKCLLYLDAKKAY